MAKISITMRLNKDLVGRVDTKRDELQMDRTAAVEAALELWLAGGVPAKVSRPTAAFPNRVKSSAEAKKGVKPIGLKKPT